MCTEDDKFEERKNMSCRLPVLDMDMDKVDIETSLGSLRYVVTHTQSPPHFSSPVNAISPPCKCLSKTGFSNVDVKKQSKGPFNKLHVELHVIIAKELDPVSQLCLGLTNRHFHTVLHEVVDVVQGCDETREYNIRRRPYDLRMRSSVDGNDTLYGWTDYGHLLDESDSFWNRSLDELLAGEDRLWKGTCCCRGCLVYKPESAWARFEFEEVMAKKHEKEIDAFEASDIDWYSSRCRRCRFKILMLYLENKVEHFKERDHPLEEEPSIGLLTSTLFDPDVTAFQLEFYEEKSGKHLYPHQNAGHETWEEIFNKLRI